MHDPMRRWNFKRDLLEGSVARNFAHLESRKNFSRIKHWKDWKDVAANARQWMIEVGDFVKFSTAFYRIQYSPLSDPVLQKGVPHVAIIALCCGNFTNDRLGHQ